MRGTDCRVSWSLELLSTFQERPGNIPLHVHLIYIHSSTMSEHYPPGDIRHSFITIALYVTSVVDNLISGFELWTSRLHPIICVIEVRSVKRADHGALNMRASSTRLPLSSVEHSVVVKKITPILCWERFMHLFVIYVTTVSVANTIGLWRKLLDN